MALEIVLYHQNGNTTCPLQDFIVQLQKGNDDEVKRLASDYEQQQCFMNLFGDYSKRNWGLFRSTCGSLFLVADQFHFAWKRLKKQKVAVIKQGIAYAPSTSIIFLVPKLQLWKSQTNTIRSLKDLCAMHVMDTIRKSQQHCSANPFQGSFQYLQKTLGSDVAEHVLSFCTVEVYIRRFQQTATESNSLTDEESAILHVYPCHDFRYQGRLPSTYKEMRGRGRGGISPSTALKEVKVLYQTVEKHLEAIISDCSNIDKHLPNLTCSSTRDESPAHTGPDGTCAYSEIVSNLDSQYQLSKLYYELTGLPVNWDYVLY